MAGRRKHSKIDALPPDIKEAVEQMILGVDTYEDIVGYLRSQGVSVSKSSVSRYARAYLAEREALIVANANMRNLMEEINRYPDLDTTEAIVRIVSHNLLSTLSAKSEDEWKEADLTKLLREANALVRASAYKKRIALQNQDAMDTGLDAVKGIVFAELAKERPDLYRQLAEYVDGKKAAGITEGG